MWLLRLLREEKCLEQLATGQRVLRVLASCLCFLEWMYRLLRAENLALQPEEHKENVALLQVKTIYSQSERKTKKHIYVHLTDQIF